MKSSALVSLALATTAAATTHMKEEFTTDPFEGDRWLHSSWKPASDTGEFEWSAGKWPVDADANKGIRTSKDAKFHAISAELDSPIASHTQNCLHMLKFSFGPVSEPSRQADI